MALEVAFKQLGVGFARAKVGDGCVLDVMQERGWLFGGELNVSAPGPYEAGAGVRRRVNR